MTGSDVAFGHLNPTLRIKFSTCKYCFCGDVLEGKNSTIIQAKKVKIPNNRNNNLKCCCITFKLICMKIN